MQSGNRAARKARARQEREAARRRMAKRRTYRRVAIIVAVLVVVGGITAGLVISSSRQKTLPGTQTGAAPWPPELDHLRARLTALGLPAAPSMAETLHIHVHLDVFVDGRRVEVPMNIGINEAQGFLTSLHTHDATGIVHIESPIVRTFTLGQVFDVWGVRFTSDCVGGYCSGGDKLVRVYVDGKPVSGDPRLLRLAAHQEIVVAYGTSDQLPRPIPSTYSFPQGL